MNPDDLRSGIEAHYLKARAAAKARWGQQGEDLLHDGIVLLLAQPNTKAETVSVGLLLEYAAFAHRRTWRHAKRHVQLGRAAVRIPAVMAGPDVTMDLEALVSANPDLVKGDRSQRSRARQQVREREG